MLGARVVFIRLNIFLLVRTGVVRFPGQILVKVLLLSVVEAGVDSGVEGVQVRRAELVAGSGAGVDRVMVMV